MHLGSDFTQLRLASNKGLSKGDYLIDDYTAGPGQENFEGVLMHFGSHDYPNWTAITKRLIVCKR